MELVRELPGGLWRDGERHRGFGFKPMSGEVELAMAEGAMTRDEVPAKVTAILAAALDHLGGEPATRERVAALAVGDRQFLARRLAARLGRDELWLTADCAVCGERFDLRVLQSELPVKEPASESPWIAVETSQGSLQLRQPTGADQEALAETRMDEEEARRFVVHGCRVPPVPAGEQSVELSAQDLAVIERALEDAAPEVALRVRAHCPECGQDHDLWVDPYRSLFGGGESLFAEIHALAAAYGWSEPEILRLSPERRRIYLALVDRSRGLVQ